MDGIRPFTMPLMRLACTALERVPVTRPTIIEHLVKKFNQDLVFCRAPDDNELTSIVRGMMLVVMIFHYRCLISVNNILITGCK
jgi:hypothetical protein